MPLGGVVAIGAPLANAAVTLRDSSNPVKIATATTNASGQYSMDVAGLTPPFLVHAHTASVDLFSLTTEEEGTLNIHPFTNLILLAYYQALGTPLTPGSFGSINPSTYPTPAQLALLQDAIKNIIAPALEAAGVDPDTFDLFTSEFTTGAAGFDDVLDQSTFDPNGVDFEVVTDDVDIVTDTSTGENGASFDTTTSSENGSSESHHDVEVPDAAGQHDFEVALADFQAFFSDFVTTGSNAAKTQNETEAQLKAAIARFIDQDYLEEGKDATAFQGDLAGFFGEELAGGTSTVTVKKVDFQHHETVEGDLIVQVAVTITITPTSGDPFTEVLGNDNGGQGLTFIRRSGTHVFKFYGDHLQFKANVAALYVRDYNPGDGSVAASRRTLQAQTRITPETMDSITVDGGENSLPADCTGPEVSNNEAHALTASSLTLNPRTGLFNGDESWDLPCNFGFPTVAAYPAAGTVYTFTFNPLEGDPVVQTSALNANTSEAVDILTINATARAEFVTANTSDDVKGTALTLTWQRPLTFQVASTELRVFVSDAANNGDDVEQPRLLPSATGGTTTTIPTTVQSSGDPVVNVNVGVAFTGVNGEKSQTTVLFKVVQPQP